MPRRPTPWLENERKVKKTKKEIIKRIVDGEEFIHWKDVRPNVVWVPHGFFDYDNYRLIHDNTTGMDWYCAVTPIGELNANWVNQRRVENRDGTTTRIIECQYTNAQYDMIDTSMWLMERGWTTSEIYQILTHVRLNWRHEVGQTPLSVGKIVRWWNRHIQELKRGVIWP